ncbi:MAG: hypothetical protein ACOX5R_13365 [bacterium]|jgi:hypothetical protein
MIAFPEQLEEFDAFLFQFLCNMIKKLGEELFNQNDLLDPKVQSLHRLYLSYLREYKQMQEKLQQKAEEEAQNESEGNKPDTSAKSDNSVRSDSSANPKKQQNEKYNRENEKRSHLFHHPSGSPSDSLKNIRREQQKNRNQGSGTAGNSLSGVSLNETAAALGG